MPIWLRKFLVVLISIFTLGMVSPAQAAEFLPFSSKDDTLEGVFSEKSADIAVLPPEASGREANLERMMKQAEAQSLEKFGSRIGPVIEDEFRQLILPNIEQAIADVASQFPDEVLESLEVSQAPSAGVSEKIFHVFSDDKDIIRFHVRRDRPPHEGYWFNFHYHTYHDQFQMHYDLGSIYWDKNTPPKWKT